MELTIVRLNFLDPGLEAININEIPEPEDVINDGMIVAQMNQDLINRIQGVGQIGNDVTNFLNNYREILMEQLNQWNPNLNDINQYVRNLFSTSYGSMHILMRMNQELTRISFEQTTRMLEVTIQNITMNEQRTNIFNQILTRIFQVTEQSRIMAARMDTNIYGMMEMTFKLIQQNSNTIFNIGQ
jgi:catabolite regulation protein CreA